MAGSNPDFNPTAFRDAVRFAMQMGAPVMAGDRATFHFRADQAQRVYLRDGVPLAETPALDTDGYPLDPMISYEDIPGDDPLQVDCAIEFSDANAEEIPVGNFRPTKVTITLLDVDFDLVKTASEVEIGGDRYQIAYRKPPLGLFDVGVWQLVAFAREES